MYSQLYARAAIHSRRTIVKAAGVREASRRRCWDNGWSPVTSEPVTVASPLGRCGRRSANFFPGPTRDVHVAQCATAASRPRQTASPRRPRRRDNRWRSRRLCIVSAADAFAFTHSTDRAAAAARCARRCAWPPQACEARSIERHGRSPKKAGAKAEAEPISEARGAHPILPTEQRRQSG